MIEYQKSLQKVQLSAGSKLEAMRVEEAVGNNKGGLEEILIEYQKSLQRVQLSADSKLEVMRVEESAGILCNRSLFLKSDMRSPN